MPRLFHYSKTAQKGRGVKFHTFSTLAYGGVMTFAVASFTSGQATSGSYRKVSKFQTRIGCDDTERSS
jgi:hypothetical protein